MILTITSFFLFAYVLISLILPGPGGLAVKTAAGLFCLACSQKFLIYEKLGGAFFAPDLPRPFLLIMETLYAALVILFFLLLIKDLAGFVLWLSRHMGTSWHLPFTVAQRNAGMAALALALGVFGVWQSVKVPAVRTVEIALPNLPRQADGFSLVQLSDIHIGPLLKGPWLRAVVERVNALHPDAVALTGDFIDGTPGELAADIAPLGDLRAKYGVYGITGNHEYYYNAAAWLPVLESLGVDMLHNEHRALGPAGAELVIAGLPDPTEKRFGGPGPDFEAALKDAPDTARVLLAHQPGGARGHQGVDMQLSGHTHGGLIFFLKPLIARFNAGFVHGLYDVDGMKLYVHPGTGLWNGFSYRLGVPSEITRFILRAPGATDAKPSFPQ